ncbi:MAG: TIGR01906 family membrane protein [Bacteroidota bacterium]
MRTSLSLILSWLATLLVPIFLLGLAVRLLLSPWFLQVEYRMPYFPPDEYGFSTADRLKWATLTWDYPVNEAGISFLGDLRFGNGTPVFNERELKHMEDVKHVVQWAMRTWLVVTALLVVLGIWAWNREWWAGYLAGLRRGGWLMLGIAAVLALFASLAFWQFFELFHALFFTGNSWLFEYSDTLIRLFPLQFWEDVFIWAAVIVVAGAIGLALGIKPARRLSAPGGTPGEGPMSK